MRFNYRRLVSFVLLASLLLICISLVYAESEQYASFIDNESNNLDYLKYDRIGSDYSGHEYGSASYSDTFFTNGNVFARVCHEDFDNGSTIDYRYYTESFNITKSIMNFLPKSINATNNPDNNGNCDTIDIDIASIKSIYPGYVVPYITTAGNQVTPLYNYKELLNGSYEIGVVVDSPPKVYYFYVKNIIDDQNISIESTKDSMLMSFVDADNTSIVESVVAPYEYLAYYGEMSGKEQVFVNGLSSLEIITVDSCNPINKTGYYLLNTSLSNVNKTCLVIENTTDVVLNFGDDIIDGDNEINGSLTNDTCTILIKDSNSITIENLRSQNFLNGLCVDNSSVNIFGDYSNYHVNGVYIHDNSTVKFSDVIFGGNSRKDIIAENNSRVTLDNVKFVAANISSELKDVYVTGVEKFPDYSEFPEDMDNINQLILIKNSSNSSWAKIKFHYTDPLPNSVVTDNLSVYKYNGTYDNYNTTVTDPVTNLTTVTQHTGWTGGEWLKLFTLVSPSENLIIAENVSNFSVFAPFGFVVDPEDVPVPNPTTGGPSGGGGGSAKSRGSSNNAAFNPEAITFDLELPDIISVKQGEFVDVPFNITYTGGIPAYNVTVSIDGDKGWETSDFTKDVFLFGENATDLLALQPYIKTIPQKKLVPVTVTVDIAGGQQIVLQKLLYVNVLPRGDLSIIKVLEYPPVIKINPEKDLDVSFLVENVGDLPIENIYIKFDESPCLKNISGMHNIEFGEIKNFEFKFTSGEPNVCDYNIKFYSGDKMVGFVPVKFIIKKLGWIDLAKDTQISILLFLLIVWTALTMVVFAKEKDNIALGNEK